MMGMRSFSRSTIRITLVFALLCFIFTNAQALDLDIKKVYLNVENESVIIKMSYEVDVFKRLQVFLFGAMPIKGELANLTNSTDFLKVGVDEAIFRVYFEKNEGMNYFPGIDLKEDADVYLNVSGTTFVFENTTKIPSFSYS